MTKYILLVEDNPDDIDLTLRAFKKNNILYEVVVARDGAEAIDYLLDLNSCAQRGRNSMPSLILLDLKLPKINGLEVLRRLRADESTQLIPVVVLTSSKVDKDLEESYRLGTNSYIRKPIDFIQFTDTIREVGSYWLSLNEPPPMKRCDLNG